MALRRLLSICPTAANTVSPKPKDKTTALASFPGPPTDPSAMRKVLAPRKIRILANRRAESLSAVAASNKIMNVPNRPSVDHKVSRTNSDSIVVIVSKVVNKPVITSR